MKGVQQNKKGNKKLKGFYRAVIEVDFILFLFYSNLLMGEYTRSGLGHKNGLWWAIQDILTIDNLIIAIVLAIIGHLVFEFLISKF
jgi:hypothetical protein